MPIPEMEHSISFYNPLARICHMTRTTQMPLSTMLLCAQVGDEAEIFRKNMHDYSRHFAFAVNAAWNALPPECQMAHFLFIPILQKSLSHA